MPEPVKGNGRYMGGLDGLRAFAVLAVVAYHLSLGWAQGGFLGVGVFFVLSGYLITDLLVQEWTKNARVNFKDFWFRRARRLLPALFLVLAAVSGWVTLFDRGQLFALRGVVITAALYVSNWWFIFHKVSYFARFGAPSPLGHLWSLAVEEQFYLVWPLLLWLGLSRVRHRSWLAVAALVLAAASALAMAFLYQPGTDPSRVYYGTDTRAFGLMIGAALAFVWPSMKLPGTVSPKLRCAMDSVGVAALLALLAAVLATNEYQGFYYRGGLVLVSLVAALLVAVLAHPATRLGKGLGRGPLRWLGVRSYGIYLWHYPVIVLTTPPVNTGGVNPLRATLQVVACIVLAALSWRFVEEPIRRGALGELWSLIRRRRGARRLSVRSWSYAAGAVLAAGLLLAGMTVPGGGTVSTSAQAGADPSLTPSCTAATQPGPSSPSTPPGTVSPSSASPQTVTLGTYGSGNGVTAIGDSVLADAAPYLERFLPGIVIDARVGRQLIEAGPVVARLKAEGRLGGRVILELGTNGPFSAGQLVALINALGPVRQVILVTTRVPRPWQNAVNQTIERVAAADPQATLVDWYAASAGKDYLFYPDGVHLKPGGSRFYARLLVQAVVQGGKP